jgi:hypothetical protein
MARCIISESIVGRAGDGGLHVGATPWESASQRSVGLACVQGKQGYKTYSIDEAITRDNRNPPLIVNLIPNLHQRSWESIWIMNWTEPRNNRRFCEPQDTGVSAGKFAHDCPPLHAPVNIKSHASVYFVP